MPSRMWAQSTAYEAIIVAVEEPPFLIPVERIVCRVEINRNLGRRRLVRLQEQRHEQALDGSRIVADLVVARRLCAAQFKAVERRLASQDRCFGRSAPRASPR
jgi:hypothetical protein